MKAKGPKSEKVLRFVHMKRLLWHQFFVATPVKGFHGVATKKSMPKQPFENRHFSFPIHIFLIDISEKLGWWEDRKQQWHNGHIRRFPQQTSWNEILWYSWPGPQGPPMEPVELRGFSQIPRGRIPSSPVPHGSSCHIAAGHTLQAGIYQPLGGPPWMV